MTVDAVRRTAGTCLVALVVSAADAWAGPDTPSSVPRTHGGKPERLSEQAMRLVESRLLLPTPVKATLVPADSQQAPPERCRRGRRALIGAAIGAGGAVPAAVLAHRRWENEAANGTAAAATMLALGAAAGAFIGLAICGG